MTVTPVVVVETPSSKPLCSYSVGCFVCCYYLLVMTKINTVVVKVINPTTSDSDVTNNSMNKCNLLLQRDCISSEILRSLIYSPLKFLAHMCNT